MRRPREFVASNAKVAHVRRWMVIALAGFVFLQLGTGVVPRLARALAAAPAPEKPQAGWTVGVRSARGVVSDYKMEYVAGVWFRVFRLRARSALLRWHVGALDPPGAWGAVPADAGPAIDWSSEGLAGVVGVFNGGFKVGAHAGGSMVDGRVLSPLVPGDMTIALDAAGHWRLGVWGQTLPSASFHPIALRQNLLPLVLGGRLTSAAHANILTWGSPLNNQPEEPRSGLGVDAAGNLVYVATMSNIGPVQLGEALVGAGVRSGMELDMNPYWPILGGSFRALHSPGPLPVQIPYSEHNPDIYFNGWQRDFFVGLAEPNSWACSWVSPGLTPGRMSAQPLHLVGAGCARS